MPRKGIIMRILTKEYLEKLKRSEAYQMIVNTPPPDLIKARKDAEIFARWIAREHRKERLLCRERELSLKAAPNSPTPNSSTPNSLNMV
jgi:hypothetical protein